MSTADPSHFPAIRVEKKRRRPALACEQCRLRKVRCDRTQPCTTCQRSHTEPCTYAPRPPPKKHEISHTAPLITPTGSPGAAILPTFPSPRRNQGPLLPRLPEYVGAGVGSSSSTADTESGLWNPHFVSGTVLRNSRSLPGDSSAPVLTPDSLQGSGRTVDVLVDRVKRLEKELANAQKQNHNLQECAQLCRDEPKDSSHLAPGTVSKTRYFGRSHWMNGTDLIPVLLSFLKNVQKDPSHALHREFQACKSLARKIKSHRVPAFSTISIGKRMPPRELADKLIDAYLRTFESVYRIVHVPTFKADYERYWENPGAATDSFVILVQLCMAIGAAFQDDLFTLRVSATQWLYEAQFWLMMPCEKSRMTIIGLQVLCLLHHAKNVTSVGSDPTWIGAGSLLRTAMYMGLHEDPKCLSKMTVFRAEMRRRLWATILEIQLQTSIDSGGPPLISPEDYDTEPPANVDDCQLFEEGPDYSSTTPIANKDGESAYTDMTVPLVMLKTWPARLAVARTVNETRSNASYNEALRVNAELTSSLQAMMGQLKSFYDAGKVSAFQLRYVEFTTYRFLIALHHPILPRALRNPVYYFSRKVCMDTSFRLASTTYMSPAAREAPTNAPQRTAGFAGHSSSTHHSSDIDFYRLFVCGAGTYRSTMTQVSTTLGLELLHHVEETPKPHCGPVSSGPAELRLTLDALGALLKKRIRAGETNIKGFISITCLLAHIDASEENCDGDQTERRIHAAAEASMKECYEILERLAHADSSQGGQWPGESADMATPALMADLDLDDFEEFDMLRNWDWVDADMNQGLGGNFDLQAI